MELSVVVAAREDDRPPTEVIDIAVAADRLGYRELWIGEGPTWDAFALATAIGRSVGQAALTVGPMAVSVRDPAMIARGAANVELLTGRTTGVALGTSSVRVVEGVHGRSRARAATVLAETATALHPLFGKDAPAPQPDDPTVHGFRRRLHPATGPLTIAAFGDRAIAIAAEHADRMVLDLVSPDQVRLLRSKLDAAAAQLERPAPRLAAWIPTAVDPHERSYTQLLGSIAGYLTVRGYREVFEAAGFGAAVELAAAGAGRDRRVGALPPEAAAVVGIVGDTDTVRARIEEYAASGLDETVIHPATAGDPAGERTLTALAEMRPALRAT
ncbi:MAG TPA: LLM class F420-dependent oxidoreductase [Nocardioidaceae bacterium]|nr:LLM class F420-dependent oxidoreductase [Nocardioidaceae bacterium]